MKSPLKIKLLLLISTILFFASGVVYSQPANPGSGDPDPSVPISGIEILIGTGLLIGARKIARLRNKK